MDRGAISICLANHAIFRASGYRWLVCVGLLWQNLGHSFDSARIRGVVCESMGVKGSETHRWNPLMTT